MKTRFSRRWCLVFGAACALGLPVAGLRAQDALDPAPTPSLTPVHRSKPKPPAPNPSLPVGTVDGMAVYQPLFKSVVADPVDRTLLIFDYNKRQARLTGVQIDDAVRDFKRSRYSSNEAALTAKLKELGASEADLRQFVTEETKLRLALASVTRGSVSEASAQRAEKDYLAGLRRQARVNKPKA